MLDRYLEEMVDKKLIENGEVLVDRENGVFIISTDIGCMSILYKGDKWGVGYNALLQEDFEKVYVPGENARLDEWYNESKELYDKIARSNPRSIEGYEPLPSLQGELPFEDAYEVAVYILSKILPKGCSQNRMIN